MVLLLNSINDTQCINLGEKNLKDLNEFLLKYPVKKDHVVKYLASPNLKGKRSFEIQNNIFPKPLIPPKSMLSSEFSSFRNSLPTNDLRGIIIDTIDKNDVTIITGGTGCGKTTQVPQFLLEQASSSNNPIQIICTQPRRLPCVAVAKRVAKERNEKLGDTVGYHIRLEQKTTEKTVLTYCTSGVLLRMLTTDELATGITHIILDEIHEREQNTDYLLIALRQALNMRSDLKLILMSATMDGNLGIFKKFFSGVETGYINVPSRLFSVRKLYLPEILALTGYMPKSNCGFFSSIGFSCNEKSQFDGFPIVEEFHCEQIPSTSNSTFCDQKFEVNKSIPGMQPSMTEPNLYPYPMPFHIPFQVNPHQITNFDSSATNSWIWPESGFVSQHMQIQRQQISNYVQGVLSDRPPSFNPDYLYVFDQKSSQIPYSELVQSYLRSGGQQWIDSVDSDLVAELVNYLMNSKERGAILVFLPGFEEIITVRNAIEQRFANDHLSSFRPIIYTLHSQINTTEQQRVFKKPQDGFRKIILSTNIAEASLTIDDVVFVIDCGKAKEKTYDHETKITELKSGWIAKSNAEQRAGRAGRCRDGFCFRLYTREAHETMPPCQIPEMLRVAIYDVCLHARIFAPSNMSVKDFLKQAPEPPAPNTVEKSLEFLEQLGALYTQKSSTCIVRENHRGLFNSNNNHFDTKVNNFGRFNVMEHEPHLTELGRIIAHLPLDPQLSRLLLFGIALRCFSPVLTLVSALSHRDPFVLPIEEDRQLALSVRDTFSGIDFSDHITLIRVFNEFNKHENKNEFCESKFISYQAMKMIQGIRRQLIFELKRLNLLAQNITTSDEPELNKYSGTWPMIQAAIVAGCFPGIAYVRPGAKLRKIKCGFAKNAALHPGSVIKRQVQLANKRCLNYNGENSELPTIEYFAYQELSRIDEGLTLKIVTVVPALTVFFFAGPLRLPFDKFQIFDIDDYTNKKKLERLADERGRYKTLMESKRIYKKQMRENARKAIDQNRKLFMQHLDALNGLNLNEESQRNGTLSELQNSSYALNDCDETDDSVSDIEMDNSTCFYNRTDHVIELENWLAFSGTFETLQSLMRLRFKFMRYFLRFLRRPQKPLRNEDEDMLECLSTLLISSHRLNGFVDCEDLYEQVEHVRPRVYYNSSNVNNSSFSGKNSYGRTFYNGYNSHNNPRHRLNFERNKQEQPHRNFNDRRLSNNLVPFVPRTGSRFPASKNHCHVEDS